MRAALTNEKVRGDLTHAVVETSTEEKNVYTLTPADRHNFGDLLFPIITERVLADIEGFAPAKHLAVTKSDLSEFGGVPTESLNHGSSHFHDGDVLVVPGGEVLCASWFAHLKTLGRRLVLGRTLERYGVLKQNRYAKLLLHGRTPQPLVIAPSDMRRKPNIAYFAVGGSALAAEASYMLPAITKRLRQAFYVSVRDRNTQMALQAAMPEKKVHLSPCAVATVGQYFPKEKLPAVSTIKVAADSGSMKFISGPYMLVQANPHLMGDSKKQLLVAIDEAARELGMPVVITVAGLAAEHDDQLLARFLFDNLTGKRVLVDRGDIEETLSLIANAGLVVSTSLHFQIVATSYAVPSVVLNHGDPKVAAYVSTWTPERPQVKPETLLPGAKVALAVAKAARELQSKELAKLAGNAMRVMMGQVSTAKICLTMFVSMLTGVHGPPALEWN